MGVFTAKEKKNYFTSGPFPPSVSNAIYVRLHPSEMHNFSLCWQFPDLTVQYGPHCGRHVWNYLNLKIFGKMHVSHTKNVHMYVTHKKCTYGPESPGWISLFKLVTFLLLKIYRKIIFFGKIDWSMNLGRQWAGDS